MKTKHKISTVSLSIGFAALLNSYASISKTEKTAKNFSIDRYFGYDISKLTWVKHDRNDNPFLNEK